MKEKDAERILREAYWIWPGKRLFDIHNTYARFHKDFTLNTVPEQGRFYITADQSYRLWVNGTYITRGPARGYQSHWPYDAVDIEKYLQVGKNYITVEVYNPGVSTFGYISQSSAGLLCAGDFGEVKVRSDATWRCVIDEAHKRDTALYSAQLPFQEHVDTRKDDRSWIVSPIAPEDWKEPTLTSYGSMPWHDLEERGIPQLQEISRRPERIVSRAEGNVLPEYKSWRNIAKGLCLELKEVDWKAESTLLTEAQGTEIEILAAGEGRFNAVTVDMGETVVGPCKIWVHGGSSGDVLDIYYHERMTEEHAPVLPDPDSLNSRVSMANRLLLTEGETDYDFYHILGFRYITLVMQENSTPVRMGLCVQDTGYPYHIQGSFDCSDVQLNEIWKICRRTEQVCSLDAYVDTPWREQAQWWGDARIQFWNTMALDNDVRLFKRGIRSIAAQRVPNGLTYGHAPTMAHSCILPDFSLVWIMTIYDYYWQTGDLSLYNEQLPRIREVLSYFTEDAPMYQGLLSHDPRYWLFLDWSKLEKKGTPTIYNLWYLLVLRTMEELERAAGRAKEAEEFRQKGVELQKAIEALLFDAEIGLFSDGIGEDLIPYKKHSVHSQTFAILLGLKPEYHEHMIKQRILPFLLGEKLEDPVPSTYWTSYVLTLARERGYHKEALDFIRRMWAPMIPYSTCPEVFEPGAGVSSVSHAWSAHPLFHLQNLLGGVVQDRFHWKRIRFAPYFAPGIDDVQVKVPSPYGVIESQWNRSDGKITGSLQLPEEIEAEVVIPGYERSVSGVFTYRFDDRNTMGAK